MTAEELKTLVRDAMREELITCGILASTPAEQIEAQADFRFLRNTRQKFDALVIKVGSVVVVTIIGCVMSLIALGFNFKFGK